MKAIVDTCVWSLSLRRRNQARLNAQEQKMLVELGEAIRDRRAAIIGPISVGDDALVGVGAVVLKSVPPRGVVAGNPARMISNVGSFDLITYTGMESDPERMAALTANRNDASNLLSQIDD